MRISRRTAITGTASAALTACFPNAFAQSKRSVIIIGAGVAGLAAARDLARAGLAVTVLEGKAQIGGRVVTDRTSLGFACDLGAGWIHGPDGGNPITALAQEAKAATFLTSDESVKVYDASGKDVSTVQFGAQGDGRFKTLMKKVAAWGESSGDDDISLMQLILKLDAGALNDPYLVYPLTAYVEFDSGGSLERLSAHNWNNDEKYPGKDVIIPAGYDAVPKLLADQAVQAGAKIVLEAVVQTVDHSAGVKVGTSKGEFSAQVAICTLPLGVLKKGSVRFTPALPNAHQTAIKKMEMGNVNKVFCRFDSAFWPVDIQYFGHHAQPRGMFAYWLNYRKFSDINCLAGIASGQAGVSMENWNPDQLKAEVTKTLRNMFGSSIPAPNAVLPSRWNSDQFALGAYSFSSVGVKSSDFANLGKPASRNLLFAGEHTHDTYRATVHGAFLTGVREAKRIIAG